MVVSSALFCLAINVFHEARGEVIPGQYAVAQVTMNRAEHDPNRVCKVVYEKSQFSWTLDDRKRKVNPKHVDSDAWNRSVVIAKTVLHGRMKTDLSRGATYYHATHVKPKWRKSFKQSAVIGRHVFYRTL